MTYDEHIIDQATPDTPGVAGEAMIRVAGYELSDYEPPRVRQHGLQHNSPSPEYAYYPFANETSLEAFVPFLEGCDGAIVGVGPDQVLDLYANCGATCAALVDYTEQTSLVSSAQLEVGLFLKRALGRIPTLEEFTHFFDFDNLDNIRSVLGRSMDDRELRIISAFFERGLGIKTGPHDEPIYFSYGDYLRARAEQKRGDGTPFAWFAGDAGREKVISSYDEGAVFVLNGDISQPDTAGTVEAVVRNLGKTISALYLSNLEDYYLLRGQPAGEGLPRGLDESLRLAHSFASLPLAADAVILRTNPPFGLGALRPSESVRQIPLLSHSTTYFHYNVQSVHDWLAKIDADHLYASGGWKQDVAATLGDDPPRVQEHVTTIGLARN